MKPEAQRIAIAEAHGFKHHRYVDLGQPCKDYWVKDGRTHYLSDLPNYLGDLNAMHEAEKVLSNSKKWDYLACLHEIVTTYHTAELVFITAAQRAEAFLRTIGRWEKD